MGKKIVYGLLALAVVAGFAAAVIFNAFGCEPSSDKRARETAEEIMAANLELVKTELKNVTKMNFKNTAPKPEFIPEEPKPYIVVRKTRDGWELSNMTGGLKADEPWTADMIKDVECIVVLESSYQTKTYERKVNGVGGGVVTLSSESVRLYFCNPKTCGLFASDFIEGKPLPNTRTDSVNYTIPTSKLNEKIKSTLHLFYIPSGVIVLLIVLLAAAGIAALVIVGKKTIRK